MLCAAPGRADTTRLRALAIGGLVIIALIAAIVITGLLVLVYQGKRTPVGNPQYVAMGSSFAAGIGLGKRAVGSPIACMRTTNGYPQQVARLLNMPIVDVSCSAATTRHVLYGGQYFQRAQLAALKPTTKLITITSGGNDVHYVGDLSLLAASNAHTLSGWLIRRLWKGPKRSDQRHYSKVRQDLVSFVNEARRRAPRALVVIVTYPTILPPDGTCAGLNINAEYADAIREVGSRLAQATREAAKESGAVLVDMKRISVDHHACSADPWVNGWIAADGARFHPTTPGARATAQAIVAAVRANL